MSRQKAELDAHVRKALAAFKTEEEKIPRYLRIGQQYIVIKEYEDAERYFLKFVNAKPQVEEGQKLLGDAQLKLRKYNDAYKSYVKAYSLHQRKEVLTSICGLVHMLDVETSVKQDWLNKAESANISQHALLHLKEAVLKETNKDRGQEMEANLRDQTQLNPYEASSHIKLIKFLHNSLRYEQCVRYIRDEEIKQNLAYSTYWYRACADVLKEIFDTKTVNVDQHFLALYLHILCRVSHLTITDPTLLQTESISDFEAISDTHLSTGSGNILDEFYKRLGDFDALLFVCLNNTTMFREGLWAFLLDHFTGQLLYLYGLVFYKRAKESSSSRESADIPRAQCLFFCALSFTPSFTKIESEVFFNQLSSEGATYKPLYQELYLEACYRSVVCYKCLKNSNNDLVALAEKVKVSCSGEKAIKYITERLMTSKAMEVVYCQQLIGKSCSRPLDTKLLTSLEGNAFYKMRSNLETMVWLMLCDVEPPTDRLFPTLNLSQTTCAGSNSVTQVDMDAFLSCIRYAIKLVACKDQTYLSPQVPRELCTFAYGTKKQHKFWTAAYRHFINKQVRGRDVVDMRKTLHDGVEVIRCRDSRQSLPLLFIAQIARDLRAKAPRKNVYYAAAVDYFKLVISRLDDKTRMNVLSNGGNLMNSLFDVPKNVPVSSNMQGLRDEARLQIAKFHYYCGEVEAAFKLLQNITTPKGLLYFARAARVLASGLHDDNEIEMAESLITKAKSALGKASNAGKGDKDFMNLVAEEVEELQKIPLTSFVDKSYMSLANVTNTKMEATMNEADFSRMERNVVEQSEKVINELTKKMDDLQVAVESIKSHVISNQEQLHQQILDHIAETKSCLFTMDTATKKSINEVLRLIRPLSTQIQRVEENLLLQQVADQYDPIPTPSTAIPSHYSQGSLSMPASTGLPKLVLPQGPPRLNVQSAPVPSYNVSASKPPVETKILFDAEGLVYCKRMGDSQFSPVFEGPVPTAPNERLRVFVFDVVNEPSLPIRKLWYFTPAAVFLDQDLDSTVTARVVEHSGMTNVIWNYQGNEYYVFFSDQSTAAISSEMLRRVFESCGVNVQTFVPVTNVQPAPPKTSVLKENPLLTAALTDSAPSTVSPLKSLSNLASSVGSVDLTKPASAFQMSSVSSGASPNNVTTTPFANTGASAFSTTGFGVPTSKPTATSASSVFGVSTSTPTSQGNSSGAAVTWATPPLTGKPVFGALTGSPTAEQKKPSTEAPKPFSFMNTNPVAAATEAVENKHSFAGFTFSTNPVIKPESGTEKTIEATKPVAKDSTAPSPFSGFSFTNNPASSPEKATTKAAASQGLFSLANKPASTFNFGGTPATTSVPAPPGPGYFTKPEGIAASNTDSKEDDAEEFEPTAEFKPVLEKLPELVDVKTGEEGEDVLFDERAKLYRFVTETKEWKERGLGQMKILRNQTTGKYRIVMRRDQVLKLCANHAIIKGMKVLKRAKDNEWSWFAQDYSEGEITQEQFVIRFKTAEQAGKFKKYFEEGVVAAEESNSPTKPAPTPKVSDAGPTALSSLSAFKPKAGSWSCGTCYVTNKEDAISCVSCSTSKPGSVAPQATKPSAPSSGFNFGVPPTTNTTTTKPSGGDNLMDKFKPKTGSWECPGCMISNDADVIKCLCCETLKPGATAPPQPTSTSGGTASSSPFKFGFANVISTTSTTANSNTTSTFSFGVPASAPAATTTFSFGIPSSTAAVTPTKFGFGIPAATTAPSFPPAAGTVTLEKSKTGGLTQGFTFGSPQKHEFSFEVKNESDDDEVVESNDVHFTPVIPLPPTVEVTTGEEGMDVLYCHRAKLYRFSDKEWKERGTGDFKILKDPASGKIRMTMRREQVFKVCLNHYVTPDMDVNKRAEKFIEWNAVDFAEGTPEPTLFALRVKNTEIRDEAFEAIMRVKKVTVASPQKPLKQQEDSPEVSTTVAVTPTKSSTAADSTTNTTPKFSFNLSDHKDIKPTITPTKNTFSFGATQSPGKQNFFGGGAAATNVFAKVDSVNEEKDDDVQLVREEKASPADVERARKLMLPDNFFLYEKRKGCKGCPGCDSEPNETGDLDKSLQSSDVSSSEAKVVIAELVEPPKPAATASAFSLGSLASSAKSEDTKDASANSGSFIFGTSSNIMTFSAIAEKDQNKTFSFASSGAKPWEVQGSQKSFFSAFSPEKQTSAASSKTEDTGNDDEVVPSDDIHFEPIIPLPQLVAVKTGEEEDEVLFVQRAKLYVYHSDTKEWKERALGDAKILRDKNDKARIVVRREMVHKVACNHYITRGMELTPLATSNHSLVWHAVDFAEGEPVPCQFAIKMKDLTRLDEFKRIFNEERDKAENRLNESSASAGGAAETDDNGNHSDVQEQTTSIDQGEEFVILDTQG